MMGTDIKGDLISRLSDYLSTHTGLYFPDKRREELKQKMSIAMREFDFDDVEAFICWLLSQPASQEKIEILARHLTVKETYFFREAATFDALENTLLPDLVNSRRSAEKRIRVWSAGCSTGEEAYSIAILLSELIPDMEDWNVSILATDINPHVLAAARRGTYSEWPFRETPPRIKEKYFERQSDRRYSISPDIKKLVTFSYLNLSEDVYPSLATNTNAMDIVLCRNVLMYFAPECVTSVVQRYTCCLVEGGYLIPSVVEVSTLFSRQLSPVRFRDATFYRKTSPLSSKSSAKVPHVVPGESTPMPPLAGFRGQRPWVRVSNPKEIKEMKKVCQTRRSERDECLADALTAGQSASLYEEALDLYKRGSYEEAEKKASEALSREEPDLNTVALMARVTANQGKLTDALEWCERAVSQDKLNPALYYLRATILDEQGRTEAAAASLKNALYLEHEFVLAHFAMGNLKLRMGKPSEARKHFKNTSDLLSRYAPGDIIPESEGITAGRLAEIARSMAV